MTLLLAAALSLRLWLAWLPLSFLLRRWLPDDAFYYFTIARNLSGGFGSSFDTLQPTNGYHPLWLFVIAPVFLAARSFSPEVPIHLTLSISATVDTATAYLCFLIVRRITNSNLSAVFSAALYAFNPFIIVQSMNGLESSLNNLCLAASVLAVLFAQRTPQSVVRLITIGIVLGLTFLARTDNVFYVVLAIALLTLSYEGRKRITAALISTATALLVCLPWLSWNYLTFGGVIQSSGLALSFLNHETFKNGDIGNMVGFALFWIDSGSGVGIIPVIILSVWIALAWKMRTSGVIVAGSRGIATILILVSSVIATESIHIWVRWVFREWYAVTLAVVAALVVPMAAALVPARVKNIALGILLVAALVSFGTRGIRQITMELYPWQIEMLTAAEWLRSNTSENIRVGSFNAGIIGYFSGRTVTNLDGVVNGEALEAIQDRELFRYIQSLSLRRIIDYSAMYELYKPFLGNGFLEGTDQVATLPGTFRSSPIVVLEVKSDSSGQ